MTPNTQRTHLQLHYKVRIETYILATNVIRSFLLLCLSRYETLTLQQGCSGAEVQVDVVPLLFHRRTHVQ